MKTAHPTDYIHELDRKTLEEFKAIPGFNTALKAFMKIFSEEMMHGLNMASKIRLSEQQIPKIYELLPPICKLLDIEEPELYLELNPNPGAYTYGDTRTFITITSGLVDSMNSDELSAVLAHECGHIACHHVLYHTMGSLILNGGADILGLGALMLPLQLAYYAWNRYSEMSCDRAAALYTKGSEQVIKVMVKLSGITKELAPSFDIDLYMKQADEYQDIMNSSLLNKAMQYMLVMEQEHPFNAVRASEIKKWCESELFTRMISDVSICPQCGNEIKHGWKFCRRCGANI